MAKIKVSGYLDTETGELTFEVPAMPAAHGRKPNSCAIGAARVLANAWADGNYGPSASPKPQRIRDALSTSKLSDDGTLRAAIRTAIKRAASYFPAPHKPGNIIYGRVGAIWFSDHETRYQRPGETTILGYAWVWVPGRSEAVYTLAKAILQRVKKYP